jgi:hypothetical protein
MYRRLTVAYGTLCREHDSPLTMTWEDEGMGIHMNEKEELKAMFSQLRCAFRQFCKTFQLSVRVSLLMTTRLRTIDLHIR